MARPGGSLTGASLVVQKAALLGPESQGGVRNKEEAPAAGAVIGVPAHFKRVYVVTGQGLVDVAPFVPNGFYFGAAQSRAGTVADREAALAGTVDQMRRGAEALRQFRIGGGFFADNFGGPVAVFADQGVNALVLAETIPAR